MKPKYGKPKPKYFDRALKLAQPGQVVIVEVAHDATCSHWRGRACDCKPDVRRVVAQ